MKAQYIEPTYIELRQEHTNELAQLIALAFLHNNKLWGSFSPQKEALDRFFKKIIGQHVESQQRTKKKFGDQALTSFINIKQGKIVSYYLSYQLQDYFENVLRNQKPQQLQLFKQLQKEGRELIKVVDLSSYPQGKAIYGNFGGITHLHNRSKLGTFIGFITFNNRLKQSGYRYLIGRASNPKAVQLFKKIGAKVLKEVVFDRQGKQFPLFFIQIDFENKVFTNLLKNLDQLKEQYQNECKREMINDVKPNL